MAKAARPFTRRQQEIITGLLKLQREFLLEHHADNYAHIMAVTRVLVARGLTTDEELDGLTAAAKAEFGAAVAVERAVLEQRLESGEQLFDEEGGA